MFSVDVEGKSIFYEKVGRGSVLVFLHGYLETHEVFSDFALRFPNNTVICPDLPGHGKSSVFGSEHSMDLMAKCVKSILENENVQKCVIYGHSMGGYVALAFARLFLENTVGVGLINSTIYVDNDEKKLVRDREIKLVESGKQNVVISNLMYKIIYKSNFDKCKSQINSIIENAKQFSPKGIIAALRGMKSRVKYDITLKIPFHLIGSDKDSFIPLEIYNLMRSEIPNIFYSNIINAGHCTFLEKPTQVSDCIHDFINRLNRDF